ncbi:hypothetical protein DIU31_012420 [Mucilaginibacter rubeus]|uniref:Uncharacterized protein n=1 Tax=Mucilaginibacter rubeus TaxID=2027860 RepID=A0AAE6JEN5_9SPHI|nr:MULTISPECIES: hypothetical protein [Mucilaginibacter]QEM04272.1 hypothetical protein DIU31_012420 [Mucilaginibacter rubeus]QEM16871.1 hypothetical protein DIU38_012540 [Mucilaginibacter gossypii]QTE46641.1 hypothetical protein J3L19_15185 [Mucilaginibacter rubeus]QTE53238.1 hypothetical protein J3L21_15160 [Mucilaginibacter rubeus]QTE58325.1 hypothetical protein J3L23_06835 [Mucilaginibacter rubeus]
MKKLKKFTRLCGLLLFMMLATAGIGSLGVAPTLTKDRKLLVDTHSKTELVEKAETDQCIADNLF